MSLVLVAGISGCSVASDDREVPDPAAGRPTLTEVDGGTGYYGRFSNSLPTSADYFPIGAWFRSALDSSQIAAYKDFGMNLFVGVENPEGADEAAIRAGGLRTLIQSDERTRFDDLGPEVAGWLLGDEVDMTSGPGAGYTVMQDHNANTPTDGKARYANYGKGVMFWETDTEAARFVNGFQHLQSGDVYWMTDPNEKTTRGYGVPASYGKTVDRLRALDAKHGQRKPIWNFIETGWPWTEDPATEPHGRILPAEARAAVWHSIIAGARGIIYFDHQFNGSCTQSVIAGQCYTDTRDALKTTNQQITALAPVLNAPTVTSETRISGSIRSMIKWEGGNFWVFAGSRAKAASMGTVSIRCVGSATAELPYENRSVPVRNGSFSDSFADGNAVHIYRIGGRSSCGL